MDYQLKLCTEKQLPEILTIYNDAIVNSTALYEYKTRTLNVMNNWYADKLKNGYPVVGAFDANKYTVEHSVYVRSDKRGAGLGKVLLREIVKKAKEQNFHVLVGVIDTDNKISINLHEQEGFVLSGIIKESGYKFGKWLDAAFYQLILKTPIKPTEN